MDMELYDYLNCSFPARHDLAKIVFLPVTNLNKSIEGKSSFSQPYVTAAQFLIPSCLDSSRAWPIATEWQLIPSFC